MGDVLNFVLEIQSLDLNHFSQKKLEKKLAIKPLYQTGKMKS